MQTPDTPQTLQSPAVGEDDIPQSPDMDIPTPTTMPTPPDPPKAGGPPALRILRRINKTRSDNDKSEIFYGYILAVLATVTFICTGPGQTATVGTTITAVVEEFSGGRVLRHFRDGRTVEVNYWCFDMTDTGVQYVHVVNWPKGPCIGSSFVLELV